MYFIKTISCGLLFLLVISDLSSADVRLCGKSLSEFLEKVCADGFNTKNLKAKKSVDVNGSDLENKFEPLAFSSLFMDDFSTNYNNLMAKTRLRRYDGVADECCRKSCAASELLSYCL